jgi:hypothetical protein
MQLVDDNQDGKVTQENFAAFLRARIVKAGHDVGSPRPFFVIACTPP